MGTLRKQPTSGSLSRHGSRSRRGAPSLRIREGVARRRDTDQLRSRQDGRCTRLVSIELAPTKYLFRIHVVLPGNHRYGRASRKRCRHDLSLQSLRPRTVAPPSRSCGTNAPAYRQACFGRALRQIRELVNAKKAPSHTCRNPASPTPRL
jgi:hypothetical protein